MALGALRIMEAFVCPLRCQTSPLTYYESCRPLEAPVCLPCAFSALLRYSTLQDCLLFHSHLAPHLVLIPILTNRDVIYNFTALQ